MCLYRYRVWSCGCDERFVTKQCYYAGIKGHVLHKDHTRRDVSVKGPCPWNCPIRRSKMGPPAPNPLAEAPTYIAMGKFALGMLKEVTK